MLLGVLEVGDVILGAEHLQEVTQSPRALGELDDKIMLEPGVHQRPFLDFRGTGDVVIAAADHANYVFASQVTELIEYGNGEGAGGLDDQSVFVVQIEHDAADLALVNQLDGGKGIADHRKIMGAYPAYGRPVYKAIDLIEGYHFALADAFSHGGRAGGFNADEVGIGTELVENATDPGAESASADGHHEQVDGLGGGIENFQSYGTLSGNRFKVVEGVHVGESALLRNPHRLGVGIVVRITDQYHLYVLTAKHAHLSDLLGGRYDGHVDGAVDLHGVAGEGKPLGMVAGAGTDNAAVALFLGQGSHLVVAAADFVATDFLQVFPLEVDLGPVAIAEAGAAHKRSFQGDAAQPVAGLHDFLDGDQGGGGGGQFGHGLKIRWAMGRGRRHGWRVPNIPFTFTGLQKHTLPLLNNLKLISAGAGSGKTYRLTQEMAGLLTDGSVRPSGIIATTFTKRAAAELKERVRVKLLREGMTQEANALSGALIGTVHGLGVKLLRRFAYEAGVSPQVDIIGDGDDQRLFNLSMAAVIDLDQIRRIELLCDKLGLSRNGEKYNWRKDVLGLVEIIRGNNFQAADIKRSKDNSWHTLRLFLPPPAENLTLEQYHTRIQRVLKETYEALYANDGDGTKKTETAAGNLRSLLRTLKQRDYLPWLEYAKMGRYEKEVGAKSRELVADLVALGEQHAALPAFQEDLRGYQDLIFDCAAASIKEYDTYKKNRGRIDYTDMEVLVLKLLDHPSVQETLTRELDLLMVDEFQDTSPIQLAIFLRLSQLAKQSIWVGDPKQSIYGFRGAEPRLMAAVMNANGTIDPANIQTDSWRSREDIVYTCNSLFVSAFPEFKPAEVALDPVRRRKGSKFSPVESAELSEQSGLIHWHFEVEGKGRYRKDFMYATLSKAIRELLANPPAILPKGATEERPLRAGDIAVLCRANYTCNEVAEAISRQGINAAIQRTGLLATAESTLLLACLKYMLNGSDSLSVAEIMLFGGRRPLAEIIDHRLDYLGTEGEKPNWGAGEELLQQLDGLRDITSEHSTSEMLNLVLERTDLRRIAAAWGDGEQRLGNLDELRRLAVAYEDNCHRQHRAASLGGYLLYLDQLIRDGQDKQGASERPDAVNVLTYHRSKGLEWPAVICFRPRPIPTGRRVGPRRHPQRCRRRQST